MSLVDEALTSRRRRAEPTTSTATSDRSPLVPDDDSFTSYNTSAILDRRSRTSSRKPGEAEEEAQMGDLPFPQTQEPESEAGPALARNEARQAKRRRRRTFAVWLWDAVHSVIPLEPSLLLENNGSVARDHLASERTFLAYVRTSLAVASTGVALVQLFSIAATADEDDNETAGSKRIQQFARPLGAITIIFGLFLLAMGVFRYFLIQYHLTKGTFPAARVSVYVMSLGLGAMVVTIFGILVAIPRGIS